MHEISLEGVKKYMDTALVLKNISFLVSEGEKAGIVGENGCGKSTILKLIAGILKLNHCAGYPYAPVPPGYDEGWVKISRDTSCAYLEQIPQFYDGMNVLDVLNLSFTEVHRLEQELHQLEMEMQSQDGDELKRTLAKYSELTQLYELKGGYDVEEKLNRICKGLKFEESFLRQDFNSLSGGEKTTVVLGKLLIDAPDVLLLDEPTNHLDMESVEWLEGYIKNYKGIVIVVSHDRYFLDHTVTKIIEVENKESKTYAGNYSDYVAQKEENLRIQLNDYKEQSKKIGNMEQSIRELREWAAKADNNKFYRRAASMQIKLDKLERVDKPVLKKPSMKLDIKTGERSGKYVIKAAGLSKSFENKTIFRQADLSIQYAEKAALIGPNGCGKTTFLKLLLGEQTPDGGDVILGANVRMAYLPQNLTFEDEELTILDYFREDISILEGKAREHLAKSMFCGATVFKKIRLLSGGEKVRLKLSKLLMSDINLLILDEPTNHLDTASIESIEQALLQFKGTIFFISHDRYFINKICDRVIAVEDHGFKSYPGNYDDYKNEKEKHNALTMQNADNPGTGNVQKPSKSGKDNNENMDRKEKNVRNEKDILNDKTVMKERLSLGDKSVKNYKVAKNIKGMEASELEDRIKTIEKEIKEIESTMERTGSDYEELNKLYTRKEELVRELDSIMELWVNS